EFFGEDLELFFVIPPVHALLLPQLLEVIVDRFLRSEIAPTNLDAATTPNEGNVTAASKGTAGLIDHSEVGRSKLVDDELCDSVADSLQEDVGCGLVLVLHATHLCVTF